jgi:hypothetical protein
MRLDLPIIAMGGFSHQVEETLPNLNDALKASPLKAPRRADRLTQLSLIGLSRFPAAQTLPPETPLILASGDANLDSTIRICEQIYAEQMTPNPISFINSVNNATAFHLSSALAIRGQGVTISRGQCSLEAAWQLADSLLQADGSPILVGTVDEIPGNPEQHRQRMQLPQQTTLGEGSHWFLCGRSDHDRQPIARVVFCGSVEDIAEANSVFSRYRISHLLSLCDHQPRLKGPVEIITPMQRLHYPTQNADDTIQWLRGSSTGSCLGMVNRNPQRKRLTISVIERL